MRKILTVLCAIAFVACTPDTPVVINNEIVVAGERVDIASAGCYYNSVQNGYSLVFTTSTTDLGHAVYDAPTGLSVVLDIPGQYANGEFDLKDIVPQSNWECFFSCWRDDAMLAEVDDFRTVKSGRVTIETTPNYLKIDFAVTATEGESYSMTYSGSLAESEEYIYCWEKHEGLQAPRLSINRNQ